MVEAQLYLLFQGLESECMPLRHYHFDIFVWNLTYDESMKRARYTSRGPEYYLFAARSIV